MVGRQQHLGETCSVRSNSTGCHDGAANKKAARLAPDGLFDYDAS